MNNSNHFLKELKEAKEAEDMGFDNEVLKKLVAYGQKLEEFPHKEIKEENLVERCASTVYLIGENKKGKMHYKATSDAAFVKGELYILLTLFNGLEPIKITSEQTEKEYKEFVKKIKELVDISMNRQQGLASFYDKIKSIANKY